MYVHLRTAEIVVNLAIENLASLLVKEANFLRGIHRKVKKIKLELQSIRAVMQGADVRIEAKGENYNNGIRVWVKQLREVAFQVEDVVDEYTLYMGLSPDQHWCKLIDFLCKIARSITRLKLRYLVA